MIESSFTVSGEINRDQVYTVRSENASATSTGVMLSTLWSQSGIIDLGGNTTIRDNEYCPLDGTMHSLTGCTNTAAAQIIYYYIEKFGLDLQLVLSSSDEYTSDYEGLNIQIKSDGSTPGTLSFAQINSMLADYDLNSASDAAALMYACAVVQKADFSVEATSTAWYESLFTRAGFKSINSAHLYWDQSYYWGSYDDATGQYYLTDGAWEVLIENLQAGRLVGTSYPGHALVIDGYDSVNDKFHINFGWGKSSATTWYSRQEMIDQQYYSFIYDLALSCETTFTVNDADLYGTGTMIRAFEQALAADSSKVTFADSISGQRVDLLDRIKLAGTTEVNNFNLTVTVNDAKSSTWGFGFYYGNSDRVIFNDFSGDLIVNTSGSSNAAFYCASASNTGNGLDGFSINTDQSVIYGGRYTVSNSYLTGSEQVLQSIKNSVNNQSGLESFVTTNLGYSFSTGDGKDVVVLDNYSAAIGNIKMHGGDDSLTVTNHSIVYAPTLSLGSGSNTITVDSTSSITGLVSGNSSLEFVLNSTAGSSAIFTILTNVYSFYNYLTSITVNIAQAVEGVYTLFTADAAALNLNYLQKLVITVTGTGEADYTLSAGGTAEGKHANLIFENNSLKLDVKDYDASDTTPPSVPGNLLATIYGNGVTLDWSDSTDNKKVEKYFYRYGTSSTLSGDGTAVTDSEATLSNLANGTYYFQVRAVDVSGNYSEWSTVKSFVINYSASPVTVFSGGLLQSSGTILSSKRLTANTSMTVSSGGSAVSTYISSGGSMAVSSGGVASNTVVSSGGSMTINYSGRANSVTVNESASVTVLRSAAASNVVLSGGRVTVSSAGSVSKVDIKSGAELYLTIYGSGANITISSGGILRGFVLQDAVTSFGDITGKFNISNAAVASSAYVYSGMNVSDVLVNYGKKLYVSSGGTAAIKFNPWSGSVVSSAGANIQYLSREKNVYFGGSTSGIVSSADSISNLQISSGLSALVYSGGTVSSAALFSSGRAILYDGGTVKDMQISSGGTALISGGTLSNAVVSSGGKVSHFSGTVNSLSLQSSGYALLYGKVDNLVIAGGSTTVSGTTALLSQVDIKSGYSYLSSGAYAGNVDVSSGTIYVYSGASAGNIQLSNRGASAYIGSGGSVGSLDLQDHAFATLSSGARLDALKLEAFASADVYGSVSSAAVGSRSYLQVRSGASVASIHVQSGGRAYFKADTINSDLQVDIGGTLILSKACTTNVDITIKGQLRLDLLGKGTLDLQGHTLNLDLTDRHVKTGILADNLSSISNGNICITVTADQQSGVYEIARSSQDYAGSFTIKCGDLSGTISLNQSLTLGGATYSLSTSAIDGLYCSDPNSTYSVSGQALTLTVTNPNSQAAPEPAEYIPGTWSTDWAQASAYAAKHNKLIFAVYGDDTMCGYSATMKKALLENPEFLEFVKEHYVLIFDAGVPGQRCGHIAAASPIGYVLSPEGEQLGIRSGYQTNGGFEAWMDFLKIQAGLAQQGVYVFENGKVTRYDSLTTPNASTGNLDIKVVNALWMNGNLTGDQVAYIYSGGIASNIIMQNNWPELTVYSGGTIRDVNIISGDIYISNGGVASNTVVSRSNGIGYMTVLSGGIASNTLVNGGDFIISNGGSAVSTTVSSGYMYLSSGGTASDITVNGGYMYLSSGGVASGITVSSGGIYVSNGGVASNTVLYGGRAVVSSGGKLAGVIANGGHIYISSGSIVSSAVLNSNGQIYIFSYGVAADTTMNSGYIYISSGGAASNTVMNNGSMRVLSGGAAAGTTINSGAVLISSGGTAGDTVINNGYMQVFSGGTAGNTVINGGVIKVSSGGTANGVTLNSNGLMYVSSGAVLIGRQVYGGKVSAYAGVNASAADVVFALQDRTTEDSVIINNLSNLSAHSYTVTVTADQAAGVYKLASGAANFNGTISIGNGSDIWGTLTVGGSSVVYDKRGFQLEVNNSVLNLIVSDLSIPKNVKIYSSSVLTGQYASVSNIVLASGSSDVMRISSGGAANNTTVNSGGIMYVSSGGAASSTTVNSGGAVYVSSGGSAVAITENGGYVSAYDGTVVTFTPHTINNLNLTAAKATLHSGTVANSTTLNNSAYLHIHSSGIASNTTVNSLSYLRISSGGMADTAAVNHLGYMYIFSGGTADNATVNSSGFIYVYSGATAENTVVNTSGKFYVSGGTADKTAVNSYGYMYVYSNGRIIDTTVNCGVLHVSGGTVSGMQISNNGFMGISSGGTADDITLNYGEIGIYSSSTISNTTVNSGGTISVFKQGTISNTTVNSGTIRVNSGTAFNTIIIKGMCTLGNSAAVNSTIINSSSYLYVSSGGTANDTTINNGGVMVVLSGGKAAGLTVHRQGRVSINSGAVLSGVHSYAGAIAIQGAVDASAAEVVFDLSEFSSPGSSFTVDNLNYLNAGSYTLTVAADQAAGEYKLAGNAGDFSSTISLQCSGTTCGTLRVNAPVVIYNSMSYALNLRSNTLTLTVAEYEEPKLPDLAISSFSVDKAICTVGDQITLSITIANLGEADVAGSDITIYAMGEEFVNLNTGNLAAGASKTLTYSWQAEFAGPCSFEVVADALGNVNESDESNNTAATDVIVEPEIVKQPDLAVSNFAPANVNVTAGESVILNISVTNQGDSGALSSFAYIYDGNVKIGQLVIGALAAGASFSGSFAVAAGKLAIGSHNLRIELDATDRVNESNESNNSSSAALTVKAPQADLSVASFALKSDSINAGESAVLSFTVKNNGSSGALSSFAYIYDGNVKLGQVVVSALSAGASFSGNFAVAAGKLAIGSHNLRIELDATNRVVESNESNNSSSAALTVKAPQADLSVAAFALKSDSINAGESATLSFTVKNNGSSGALSSFAYIYDGNVKIGQMVVGALAAGASFSGNFAVAASKLAIGSHNLRIELDATNRVVESNESNNSSSAALTVKAPQADLSVASFALKSDSINAGESAVLSFTVKNNGSSGALSSYAYIYDGNVKLGQVVVSALSAGASFSGNFAVAAGKLAIGSHNFRIELDATNRVVESNESNNSSSAVLTVKAPQADLQIKNFSIRQSPVVAGTSVTLDFTVKNAGQANALASWVYLYDGNTLIASGIASALSVAGEFSGQFTIAAGKLNAGFHNLTLVLDATSRVAESNESNNTATLAVMAVQAESAVSGFDSWEQLGVGDFDGDGLAVEPAWLESSSGQVAIQFDDNSRTVIGCIDSAAYELSAIGDFNGDNIDDIAWSADSGNLTVCWQIEDKKLADIVNIGSVI